MICKKIAPILSTENFEKKAKIANFLHTNAENLAAILDDFSSGLRIKWDDIRRFLSGANIMAR